MRAILFTPSAKGRKRSPFPTAGVLALGLTLGIGFVPAGVRAAAYVLETQSPAGVGLAGAMVARADDASAIFYNPAGLGFQTGLSVLAGVALVMPAQSVTQLGAAGDPGGGVFKAQSNIVPVPTLFIAARVSDYIALGFGAYVHHGGGTDWQNPDDPRPFPGRYRTLRSQIQSITFNPSIAIRVIPEVSVGGGIDIEVGSLLSIRALNLGSAEGRVNLSGGSVAVGGNIGALARFLDGRLNFGLAYRSAINLHFGNMQATTNAPTSGAALPTRYTQASTDVPAPNTITLGLAGKPASWLTISADAISSLWSSVHEQRFVLTDGMSQTQTTIVPRDWKDSYSGRLGVEIDLGPALLAKTKLWPKIRGGFGYDQSPVPAKTLDPSVPDSDRYLASAGLSLGYRGVGSLELGYQAVIFRERASENLDAPLTYNTMLHVFSAALNLQLERVFGKRRPEFASRLLDRSPELPPELPPEESAPASTMTP